MIRPLKNQISKQEDEICIPYLAAMKKSILLLISLFFHSLNSWAQLSSAEILQKLQKLGNTASVLYVAAHPDDENTRLLSYLSRELHCRTAYLSLTRGDGGQNLIGPETEEALGLIRTQELLAARKIDGAQQFFTRAFDFGYSKNPEETFSIWNRDSVLHDVVWVIRNFKPDIIITRFPTTGEGGHGHHTASAILSVDAFKAAADPKMFPNQLKFVNVWQPKKLFWNNFMPSRDATTNTNGMIKMDVGSFNQNLGLSIGEIASMSRSQHKSQGFGVKMQRGEIIEYFTQLAGDTSRNTIFDGISTSWSRYPNGAAVSVMINQMVSNFDPYNASATIPQLVVYLEEIKKLGDEFQYQTKLKDVEDLLLALGGVYQDITAPKIEYLAGDTLTCNYNFIYRRANMVNLVSLRVPGAYDEIKFTDKIRSNQLVEKKIKIQIPSSIKPSNPYWISNPHGEGLFVHSDFKQTGQPDSDPTLFAEAVISVNGILIKRKLPIIYKWVDPVKGELIRRVEVVPSLRGFPSQKVAVSNGKSDITVDLNVEYLQDSLEGEIFLKYPDNKGIQVIPERIYIPKKSKGKEKVSFTLRIKPSREVKMPFTLPIEAYFSKKGMKEPELILQTKRIEHDHIPTQTYHEPCTFNFTYTALERSVSKIGYIEGAGDDVAEALQSTGYSVEVLDDAKIRSLSPKDFQAVVVGIRALNSVEQMAEWMPLLLEYTKNGGTLIMQYNTKNWISDVKVNPGPFPFEISRNRVTNEKAPVKILKPEHPLFNYPNKITNEDFDGWVQERGIYFTEKCSEKYDDLLLMADPNDTDMKGSLIYTAYGSGHFIYTGLAFFRQLPAGVPGAFRLFSNFLSVGNNEQH
jgi:LmbE family N-acetylglucosaminyl deacetylase